MTGLIKSAEARAARVRRLPAQPEPPAAPTPTPADVERQDLLRQIASLRRDRDEQQGVIDGFEGKLLAACQASEAKGYQAGRQAAENAGAEALKVLEANLERALRDHGERMRALDALAILIARTSLEKVLGEASQSAALVAEIVARQMVRLADEAALRVEVSAIDFPSEKSLKDLRRVVARKGLEIIALPDAAQGECRIRLQLGALEVGPNQQLGALRALFDEALEGADVP